MLQGGLALKYKEYTLEEMVKKGRYAAKNCMAKAAIHFSQMSGYQICLIL